jgi:hypothetical protein
LRTFLSFFAHFALFRIFALYFARLRISALFKSEKSANKKRRNAQKCANAQYFAHFCALYLRISAIRICEMRKTAHFKAQKCADLRISAL